MDRCVWRTADKRYHTPKQTDKLLDRKNSMSNTRQLSVSQHTQPQPRPELDNEEAHAHSGTRPNPGQLMVVVIWRVTAGEPDSSLCVVCVLFSYRSFAWEPRCVLALAKSPLASTAWSHCCPRFSGTPGLDVSPTPAAQPSLALHQLAAATHPRQAGN